ncbi:unnamed protein product [Periconia digitata]|uniref:Uncharacterized protein n=1 Tax=Periconia digitata TaxID=1303443 RepID=A0A9W4XYH0_9PLEO|nr:unnamed protein product [Periconia digitata]
MGTRIHGPIRRSRPLHRKVFLAFFFQPSADGASKAYKHRVSTWPFQHAEVWSRFSTPHSLRKPFDRCRSAILHSYRKTNQVTCEPNGRIATGLRKLNIAPENRHIPYEASLNSNTS